MNVLTRYTFISTYNAEKLTKQQATTNNIGSVDFSKCDKDGDGEISLDEILANQDVCDKLMKAIQAKIDKNSNEQASLKAQQAKAEQTPEKQFELAA